MNFATRIGVLLVAIAAGVLVVASAVVNNYAASLPEIAGRIWPSHPAVEIAVAMRNIAKDARAGRPASDQALQMLQGAAIKQPLAPEPFLAHGVAAALGGQVAEAEASFQAAKLRAPRSLPARYFLSGIYLRSNDLRRGLEEVAEFARLSPSGVAVVGPYVAAIARQRSTWPDLRAIFRDNPAIEQASLVALAADPANADSIIALQGHRRSAADAPWIRVLIGSLVDRQEYGKARAVFAAALDPAPLADSLLFDRAFDWPDAPVPFNWMLTSSTVGLAERQKGGKLHVIFYGQEDGALATQLLVLPPGPYRLSMAVSGGVAALASMSWRLRCANRGGELLAVPLSAAARAPARFSVPANCPAQWIELSGRAGDITQSSEATISRLALERAAPGA